jgi:hypothetical protein
MTVILKVQKGKAREEVRAEIEDDKRVHEFEEMEKRHRKNYYVALVVYWVKSVVALFFLSDNLMARMILNTTL